jgi:hypothetical protein
LEHALVSEEQKRINELKIAGKMLWVQNREVRKQTPYLSFLRLDSRVTFVMPDEGLTNPLDLIEGRNCLHSVDNTQLSFYKGWETHLKEIPL